nr:tRNA1(Val) (adenine(37)-N6)-methyltransferase [Acholeplasmatales bacterium]
MTIVCNELLGRKLLKIYQDPDYFSFSIDSVLLASFATINPNTKRVCDLCSGNAPIPLYLTLRSEKIKIVGVEVQTHSYDLAVMSINENKLNDRIEIENDNLIDINKKIGNDFDLVTCNPPYFKVGEHNVNPKDSKAIARHEILATLDDILKEAYSLLKSKGRFAMVHRPQRLIEILETMKKHKIMPKRIRFIYPKKDKECNHILIEGIKDGNDGSLRILPPL